MGGRCGSYKWSRQTSFGTTWHNYPPYGLSVFTDGLELLGVNSEDLAPRGSEDLAPRGSEYLAPRGSEFVRYDF